MNLDPKNQSTVTQAAVSAARTSTVTGTGFDVSGYIGNITFVQAIGTVSGTTPTLDGKIQDSADDSSYTDVSGATFTQVTASTSLISVNVDTRSVRKYLRYVGTIAGTTPVFNSAVLAIGTKQVQP